MLYVAALIILQLVCSLATGLICASCGWMEPWTMWCAGLVGGFVGSLGFSVIIGMQERG